MKKNKKPLEENSQGDNCNIDERRALHLQLVAGVLRKNKSYDQIYNKEVAEAS